MLRDQVEFVIGVDTHQATHTAAVLDVRGGVRATTVLAADAFGYRRLRAFAQENACGRRVWAIEGSGSFGSGLATFLLEHGEWVVEVDRPHRPATRTGAKSDERDAVRAAREALTRSHLAQPRRRGEREALRILLRTRQGAVVAKRQAMCHLHALVVTAPEMLRQQLRGKTTKDIVLRGARLRTTAQHTTEHRTTIIVLRTTARRILALEAEAHDLETLIDQLVQQRAPSLLDQPGIGSITAAEVLCAWSHAGRLHSEAAFAALAGRRADSSVIGQGHAPSSESWRRPPTESRAPHHRVDASHLSR